MADALDHIKLKLRLAHDHFKTANDIAERFLGSYFYTLRGKIDANGLYTIEIDTLKDMPPGSDFTLGRARINFDLRSTT